MVYKIGITGGMASGKSRCLQYLASLKSPRIYTINLDQFANQIYVLNPYALTNLRCIFGPDSVTTNPQTKYLSINREYIGN